jgi:hypothetical protein
MERVNVNSVDVALKSVASGRADQERKDAAELAEVDQEVEGLQTAIANLTQQLQTLASFRDELRAKHLRAGGRLVDQRHAALFETLEEQKQAINARSELVASTSGPSPEQVTSLLDADPTMRGLHEEFRQYKETVEPTLEALPATYRSVIVRHHDGIKGRIEAYLKQHMTASEEPVDAPVVEANVVFAVDEEEGQPLMLIIVVPVTGDVHSGWMERDEDLNTWIGARVVQAAYEASRKCGLPGAQAMVGAHRGLLAIELDVEGASEELAQTVISKIETVFASASEIGLARVALTATQVDVDDLIPDDGLADEETVEGSDAV